MESDFKTRVLQSLTDETLEDLAKAIEAEMDRRYPTAELAREVERGRSEGSQVPDDIEEAR